MLVVKKTPVDVLHFHGGDYLFVRDDDPQDYVGQQSRDAAGDQRDQKGQPKPEGTDPEEFSQTATHPGYNSILSGSAQIVS